jgi:hypothetical protein
MQYAHQALERANELANTKQFKELAKKLSN